MKPHQNLAGSSPRTHNEIEYRDLLLEYQALQKKLASKTEALLMVSEELAKCQADRDDWRHKAEIAQHRALQLEGTLSRHTQEWSDEAAALSEERERLLTLVSCMRKENRGAQEDAHGLRQQLKDAQGDTKLLRQQLARLQLGPSFDALSRRSSSDQPLSVNDEHRGTSVEQDDSEGTIKEHVDTSLDRLEEVEKLRQQYGQMERDLRSLLCEKEELISEREAYKAKHDRLSQELSYIMNGDDRRVVTDVDGLVAENRYLKAQLQNAQEETGLAQAALNRYRSLVDKRRGLAKSQEQHTTTDTSLKTGSRMGNTGGKMVHFASTAMAPAVVTPKQSGFSFR